LQRELFEIGGLTIYAYGTMLFLAFLIGIGWALREAPKENIDRDHFMEASIIAIILAILGSRIAYVAVYWEYFQDAPWWSIFAFRDGGLIFYGGFFAALLGALIYCRYRRMSFFSLMDLAAPFIALGYAITRVGCFLNGCCYGEFTDVPWGVVFPVLQDGIRHPTQLYSSFAVLFIFVLLRLARPLKYFNGFIFILFVTLYGVYRFIVEFYRVDPNVLSSLSLAQIVALVMVAAGAFVLVWKKKQSDQRMLSQR